MYRRVRPRPSTGRGTLANRLHFPWPAGLVVAIVVLVTASASAAMADSAEHFAEIFDLTDLGPRLIMYTDEGAAQDLAVDGAVVYYFAATWCPDCREGYEDLKTYHYRLPAGLTVIFVDFDTEQALKRKYGVPIQDVFVQINAKGERLKLWVAGGVGGVIKNLVRED